MPEWTSVVEWTKNLQVTRGDKISKDLFTETVRWLNTNIISKYSNLVLQDDELIKIDIPRNFLQIVVFSVGKISYDFNIKPPTAAVAYNILIKIEDQIKTDSIWIKWRY